ncbi:nucleotide exchange factor GrpE [Candidatus Parvarchaeota archaeon]|nr:nucleotide exchange factor GrpE [Candidatus Parvarchaeota archaeon]
MDMDKLKRQKEEEKSRHEPQRQTGQSPKNDKGTAEKSNPVAFGEQEKQARAASDKKIIEKLKEELLGEVRDMNKLPEAHEQGKIAELQEKLLADGHLESIKQLAASKDAYARLAAEFDNYRKRSEKEKAEARSAGAAKLLLPLLSFADELELACKSATLDKESGENNIAANEQEIKLKQGLEMLNKKFEAFLLANGVSRIKTDGQAFNAELHDAVMLQDDKEDNIILFEIQPGYMLNGSVLRHAKVCVSKNEEKAGNRQK